ncbi:pirin family protein [Rhizobium rhizogenes]|uniref:Uncharacterized protein n=1 Tax=Rhizobium rhizogenes (strain K84 / ATCC BAA-868) TaxID=311403 RepID=B9JML1_RHIR8|nr:MULTISPECIES: pirin-like C-terminal cupin domain-containing protein [Rhizobium]ACM28792.1 conserved hypothetical protein [Rhizobium rhizogenes K84]OCJ19129.1 pirin [Agrobacterium sp. B131/95]EJK88089.1 Pirin-related protein [Rhizobium sp. AP16]NTI24464.1 pirin family protein [Rhizobium rhizogenes]NTI43784.1 pirin family protein [Rhizobium rhizogenes]
MSVVATLRRTYHGRHFRACGLRDGDVKGLIDPFIGFDNAWVSAGMLLPHPQASFEAASYLFLDSETGMRHGSSPDDFAIIRPGGLLWSMVGTGESCEEVPLETDKTVHAFHVLMRSPHERASAPPFTSSLEPQDVPVVRLPGARIRVLLGRYGVARSPLKASTDVTLLDISLAEGSELIVPVPAGECAFAMPIFGAVDVDGNRFDHGDLKIPIFPARADPQRITLRAIQRPAKVALFGGRPLHQSYPKNQEKHHVL